ncbi:MAG: SpoIID/LytB domain-containing protein [Firmicutes bacterium]|nr:SpoIID/LytB domain-containing protein [Bacillota bacterium]
MNQTRVLPVFFALFFLLACLFVCSPRALSANIPEIRVLLSSSSDQQTTVSISAGSYTALNIHDEALGYFTAGDQVSIAYSGGKYDLRRNGELVCEGESMITLSADSDGSLFTFKNVKYRGDFKAISNGVTFYSTNVLDMESYLYGVVGKEIGYNLSQEAMKAQAIASRSYAIANLKPGNIYYDVTNTTSSQVYGGYSAEGQSVTQAVDGTHGQVVYYNGKTVDAVFHSNSGGHTENVENIWGSSSVPLQGVSSPYDSYAAEASSYGASTYAWTVEYTADKLVSLANTFGKKDIGDFVSIEASTTYNGSTSVSGRALTVVITGTKGSVTAIRDTQIRSLLQVKSSLIEISGSQQSGGGSGAWMKDSSGKLSQAQPGGELYGVRRSGTVSPVNENNDSFFALGKSGKKEIRKDGSAVAGDVIRINGKGYGHGVGMSQWGAIGMAVNGYSVEKIIMHYYGADGTNGVTIHTLY